MRHDDVFIFFFLSKHTHSWDGTILGWVHIVISAGHI